MERVNIEIVPVFVLEMMFTCQCEENVKLVKAQVTRRIFFFGAGNGTGCWGKRRNRTCIMLCAAAQSHERFSSAFQVLITNLVFQAPLKLFFQFKQFSRSCTCHLERMRTKSEVRSAQEVKGACSRDYYNTPPKHSRL